MTEVKKTILTVDDDIDILEQLRFQLEGAGYRVISAGGQEEAMEMLKDASFDMAILDLMMENMDSGFVLCHHIKKLHPGTPVIILTAVTSETGMEFDATTHEERSWVKADILMDKPVRSEQLLKEVHKLLNRG
mgnify:CR=1 FL=1